MRTLDLLRLSALSLLRQPRRSVLSLIGLAIGVAAVIILTAVGRGARTYVEQQFEVLGTHTLAILPGHSETTGGLPGFGGVPHDLTLEDARAVGRQIPGVLRLAPVVVANEECSAGGRSRRVVVVGTTAEYGAVRALRVRTGRFLSPGSWDESRPEVVLGKTLATELFPEGGALGQLVRVGGWRLRVIGVLARQGTTFGFDLDQVAFIPVRTAMTMFNKTSLFRVVLQSRAGSDMHLAEQRVRRLMIERHGEEDVTVATPEAIVDTLGGILDALTLALAGIAAISLLVAGIGIMNVMLVSVSERTAEIGLLKAIGANHRQVLALFLAEAAILSLAGGVLGLGVGLGLVKLLVTLAPTFPAAPPSWAILSALLLSLSTGVAFGWLPARRAVGLDPIAALAKEVL